jgi:hypothetical protein
MAGRRLRANGTDRLDGNL